jgi:hypothetical protein
MKDETQERRSDEVFMVDISGGDKENADSR